MGLYKGGKAIAGKVIGSIEKKVAEEVEKAAVKRAVGKTLTAAEERAARTASIQAAMDAGMTKGATKKSADIAADMKAAETKAAIEKAFGMTPKPKPPGLAAHRVDVGARRASGNRDPLMTELVRGEAGPVMGEGLGQASPLLPRSISKDILLKMKSLRPEERLAYVAKAKDLKTKVQVEAMRRQLEDLGLLVPLAAGAGFASQQDRR
jgi:hypothetical protein